MAKKNTARSGASGQKLRIIGGQWRSRVLPFPDVEGLRPTGNRVRETLFNWLMPYLPNARVLDLFAGSAALGLEALSRDAAHCTFCESNALAGKQIQANLKLLNAENATIYNGDALQMLKESPQQHDIVFIDPPFTANLWEETCRQLENSGWLAKDALIYVESPKNQAIVTPNNWQLYRSKQSGDVHFELFKRDIKTDTL